MNFKKSKNTMDDKHCCCCCGCWSVVTKAKIITILTSLGSIIGILITSSQISVVLKEISEESNNLNNYGIGPLENVSALELTNFDELHTLDMEIRTINRQWAAFMIFWAIFDAILLLSSLFCFYGLQSRKRWFMIPFLVVFGILTLVSIITIIGFILLVLCFYLMCRAFKHLKLHQDESPFQMVDQSTGRENQSFIQSQSQEMNCKYDTRV